MNAPLPDVPVPLRQLPLVPDNQAAGLGVAFMIAAAMLHSLGSVVSKILLLTFTVPQLSLLRTSLTLVVLAILLLVHHRDSFKLSWKDLPAAVGYGFAAMVLSPFMFFNAIDRLSIGIVLIIEYTSPILIIIWLRIVRGTRIRSTTLNGMVLCIGGLSLVALPGGGVNIDAVGVLFAMGAAVALATGYLLAESALQRRPAIIVSMLGFAVGTMAWALTVPAWTFPIHLLIEPILIPNNLGLSPMPAIWFILGVVVFCSVTPALMVLQGVKLIGPARASAVSMSEPVFSAAMAWFILGEYLSSYQLSGGIIAITGLIYLEGPWRKTARVQQQ